MRIISSCSLFQAHVLFAVCYVDLCVLCRMFVVSVVYYVKQRFAHYVCHNNSINSNNKFTANRVGVVIALVTCFRKVLDSNLDRDFGCPD
jgi:hypothetical protein